MEIILASTMGFCEGVKRAVEMVDSALKEGTHPVYTLGEIIHNPAVVKNFKDRGVEILSSLKDADGGTVVLRSHGTTLEELAERPKGVKVQDATCPWVKAAQRKAASYAEKGSAVILVGKKDHPEIKAILSHAGENAYCVRDSTDIPAILPKIGGKTVFVLSQTTSREDEVQKVVDSLKDFGIRVSSQNTICASTGKRQAATRDLAARCDLVLVVGGKASSNTNALLQVALSQGAKAYLVESADDVSPRWFRGKRRVGITAGASTPDYVIKEVVGKVEDLEKTNFDPEVEETSAPEPQSQGSEIADEPVETAQETTDPEETPEVGEQTPEEITEDFYDESFKAFQDGQIVDGRVVAVDDKGVLVDVGAKSEGLIPASEFHGKGPFASEEPQVGDDITVYVVSQDVGEQGLRLSKRKADEEIAWRTLEDSYRESAVVEAPVVQQVKGGLVVDIGLRGFVPASQVERGYVNDLSKYVGTPLRLRVLELDRAKNRVVLSQRVVLEEEHENLCQETWSSIEEGQVRQGVVKGITDFGVFVDLGGVDGLLHISELSWGRVKHPREVVEAGQDIEVKVLRVDKERGKISLGRKQVLPDPWGGVEDKYPVGSEIEGEVTRTAPFGAFVQIEPGVEGLVHISEIADRHIAKPEEEVNSGDNVKVKVLRVSEADRRISLSIRQADQYPYEEINLYPTAAEEVSEEEPNTQEDEVFEEVLPEEE